MDKVLLTFSTLCFLGGFIYAVLILRSEKHQPSLANLAVIALGFFLQSWALFIRGELHGRCPITNFWEILVFFCWCMVLLYLLLGRAFRLSLLGVFTSPIVFIVQTLATLGLWMGNDVPKPKAHVDPWFELHASVSFLAYGAFALACVAGCMYLVQDRLLKEHHLNTLFYNLPPIQNLSMAIFRLIAIGVVLLTVGMAAAFLMEERPTMVHTGLSFLVWIAYLALAVVHLTRGLGSKKLAGSAVAAFLLPLITLLIFASYKQPQ